MAEQSLIWTTLPNGYTEDGRGVRMSILLSPRLHTDADPETLASFFPDWEDWPATLARATFRVRYGTGAAVAVPATRTTGPTRVDTTFGAADSDLWKALFHAGLSVHNHKFKDHADTHVASFDTVAVAGLVQSLYGKLAAAANGHLPKVSDIVEDPDWLSLVESVAAFDGRTTDQETGLRRPDRLYDLARAGELSSVGGKHPELAHLQLFHTPPQRARPVTHARTDDPRVEARWLEHERRELPAPAELTKQLDFHQIVAAMGSYPTLLRRLGLVVDLVIARDQLVPAADQELSTTVRFAAGALTVPRTCDASPITRARLTDRIFDAVPNPAPAEEAYRVADGLLDLDPGRFALLQADVDGAGLKLMGFARSLRHFVTDQEDRVDPTTRFEKEAGAPALRTAGLMLVQRERGAMLEDRFGANKDKNDLAEQAFAGADVQPVLWAEDVVRGFRFDVWDRTTARWRSLCRRDATYEVGGAPPIAVEEEGTVRLAATGSPDPKSNQDVVHLHEAVVSWTGWSLTAPPPGRAIWRDGPDVAEEQRTVPAAEPELPPGLDFRSRYTSVRGSLPRLRFGREYWLRARAVDLAGNSLPPRDEDFGSEKPAQNAQPFLRYEPVAAPAVALVRREDGTTERPAEGESMQRVAIRSFNDTPADNAVPTDQTARRFAVPPQASVKDAEHHGMLDAGGKVDPSTFNLLAHQKDRDASDPAAALVEEKITTPGLLPTDPPDKASYAVYRDGQALTYLPDPLARVAVARIFGHPDIPDTEIFRIPLYPEGDWPEAQPFKIEVFEDPGAVPQFDAASRTLRVPLAKGDRATVRLSMAPSKRALREILGIWRWLSAADQASLEPMALNGQHWMLTPWITLDLVHATQRPLIAPEIVKLEVVRELLETSARPRLRATCSLKSTDRLDLRAEWHEPVDDPEAPAAVDRERGDVAFAVKVTDRTSYATRLDGHARGGDPDHTVPGDDLIEINSFPRFVERKQHEFNDTRYRRIEYWLEATTKFREYLPPELLTEGGQPTEAHIKVVGPREVSWVPSSAPPPAPEVLYVVPTFGWVRSTDAAGNAASWRRGGGLRVYLGRPWNVSGYGEMLAVVLPPPGYAGDPEENNPDRKPEDRPLITQWGNDPIWESSFVTGLAPQRSSFPLARTAPDPDGAWLPAGAPETEADQKPGPFQVTGLLPPGVPPGHIPVEIAPHDVAYDAGRQLWYCDIEVDQGASYWPFIRLALARYQPVSAGGAHLSEVVLADFMPLTADRWLNVKRTNSPRTRRVTVFGHTYSDSSGHREVEKLQVDPNGAPIPGLGAAEVAPSSIVEVWVERLDPARGEDFGWQRVSNATVRPAGAPAGPSPVLAGVRRFVPAARITRALELHRDRRFDELVAEDLVDSIFSFLQLWEGDVTLPREADSGARFRLVIAEYEEYLVDDDRPYDPVPRKKDRRLVFVEHVELG